MSNNRETIINSNNVNVNFFIRYIGSKIDKCLLGRAKESHFHLFYFIFSIGRDDVENDVAKRPTGMPNTSRCPPNEGSASSDILVHLPGA